MSEERQARQTSSRERRRRSSSSGRGGSRERGRSQDDRRNKDPESYTQVYVAKLHRRTNEDDIRDGFSKYGRIS